MHYKKLFIIPILLAILTINLTPVYAIEEQNSTEETEILETTEEITELEPTETIEEISESQLLEKNISEEQTIEEFSFKKIKEITTQLNFYTSSPDNINDILPKEINVILEDGSEETISVSWSLKNLNEDELIYEYNMKLPEKYKIEEDTLAIINVIPSDINSTISTYNSRIALNNGISLSMDGYFDDWNDKPYSYEYNWDNSANCWYYGVWYDGQCFKTPEGTYDTTVRHKMQLYSDNEYVYMHIVISGDYGSGFNGEDYNFYFDEQSAKFQITDLSGNTLTNNVNNMSPGIYEVLVRHGDSSMSYAPASGSEAYLYIPDNHRNIEIEFKIPYGEFIKQNPNINLDKTSSIEFFTPNLMYRHIISEGSPTGAWIAILAALTFCGIYFLRRNKNAKIL